MNDGHGLVATLMIIGFFLIYFLPTIIANRRMHNNRLAIFVLNLFAGWTVIAWVIALVWACTNDTSGVSAPGNSLLFGSPDRRPWSKSPARSPATTWDRLKARRDW